MSALFHDGFYFLDDADDVGGERAGILHIVVDDAVEHLLLIVPWERRLRAEHKVNAGLRGSGPSVVTLPHA